MNTFPDLYQLLTHRAMDFPGEAAVSGQQGLGWRTVSGRELLHLTDRLAEAIRARGVRPGDRVVLWVPNHWRTPVYLFAIWKLGAVAVPFDREMNPEGAARIVQAVEPRLILAGYGERPAWAQHALEWWEPEGGDPPAEPSEGPAAAPGQASRTDGAGMDAGQGAPADGSRLAAIFFTSGTTGVPKGCMITHGNLCSQVEALQYTVPLDGSSRLASILPLSHLFEMTVGLLYPLSRGASIHYVPSRRGPDILRVLNEQRITHIIAVPQLLSLMGSGLEDRLRKALPGPVYTTLHAVARHLPMGARRLLFAPAHRALGGHLRMMASGGASLPLETQALWERLGVRVLEGYGTSECSPVVACARADGSTPPGSVGQALRGVEVHVTDAGELTVRGPNVMAGYWRDPEQTAEVLRDGWYSTGDMASIDALGNIRILGRVKDLIALPSGLKVWPQDVEDVLREHPSVRDAAVLAVPGATGGATLHAYLVPRSDGALPAGIDTIVSECNARLAVHQRVSSASWWQDPDFPRTSTLKVRRNLLPRPQSGASTQVVAALAADDPVGQAIAGVTRGVSGAPEQTLGELGLDSLGLVELALALEEKTGHVFEDGDLHSEMTVSTLRTIVAGGEQAAGLAKEAGRGLWRTTPPLWPFTWGRLFRVLALPVDLLYRRVVTRTEVLGGEHLHKLPERLVIAGTHHGFPDMPLIRLALRETPARHLSNRLAIAAGAEGFGNAGLFAWYAILAFGLYPLRQYREREASLRGLLRVARNGNAVLIFPQGSHTDPADERSGTRTARFRTGVAHLADALDAGVLPFGVAGTERVMPSNPRTYQGFKLGGVPMSFTPGPLAIAFGAPLQRTTGETPEEFTERLQAACYALTRDAEAALERS